MYTISITEIKREHKGNVTIKRTYNVSSYRIMNNKLTLKFNDNCHYTIPLNKIEKLEVSKE